MNLHSRYYSHLNSTSQLLSEYRGDQPFSLFIKNFFSQNKKFGSRDRKQIANLAYCYFRTGNVTRNWKLEDAILAGIFLCSTKPNELLSSLKPEWAESIGATFEEKMKMAGLKNTGADLFPFNNHLSESIDAEEFGKSHLLQPDLFIRIRPGYEKKVNEKLQSAEIPFREISKNSLALENITSVEKILELDKEAVVQDLSSQRVAEFLEEIPEGTVKTLWDACAASGGKSIMAYDTLQNIKLTVSDLRENILHNLRKRFEKAGIGNYKAFVADLSSPNTEIPVNDADLIICDAPCSGSGTWGRNPEQLLFFKEEKINYYSSLQKKIIENTIPRLKKGGYFLYITCSVFKEENEENVAFIQSNASLKLIRSSIIKGYDKAADTMFAALYKKEN